MSSFWDSLGQKLLDGTLSYEDHGMVARRMKVVCQKMAESDLQTFLCIKSEPQISLCIKNSKKRYTNFIAVI